MAILNTNYKIFIGYDVRTIIYTLSSGLVFFKFN
jgi:hypothetical protein